MLGSHSGLIVLPCLVFILFACQRDRSACQGQHGSGACLVFNGLLYFLLSILLALLDCLPASKIFFCSLGGIGLFHDLDRLQPFHQLLGLRRTGKLQ